MRGAAASAVHTQPASLPFLSTRITPRIPLQTVSLH